MNSHFQTRQLPYPHKSVFTSSPKLSQVSDLALRGHPWLFSPSKPYSFSLCLLSILISFCTLLHVSLPIVLEHSWLQNFTSFSLYQERSALGLAHGWFLLIIQVSAQIANVSSSKRSSLITVRKTASAHIAMFQPLPSFFSLPHSTCPSLKLCYLFIYLFICLLSVSHTRIKNSKTAKTCLIHHGALSSRMVIIQ